MLNGITSPSEVMNAAIADTKPAAHDQQHQQKESPIMTKTASSFYKSSLSSSSFSPAESKPASFAFSGVHLCVPYNIRVNIDSTADPSGAERHAKKVIDDIFNLATTIFHQEHEDEMKNGESKQGANGSELININSSSATATSFDLSEPLENLLLQTREVCRGTDNVFYPVIFSNHQEEKDEKQQQQLTFDDCFELKLSQSSPSSSTAATNSFYQLVKKVPTAKLDLYGISKGWIIDAICNSLISSGFSGVLVDWGGDIKGQGKTALNEVWTIGLERAAAGTNTNTKNAELEQKVITSLVLCDAACATSGNYKQKKDHIRIPSSSTKRRRQRENNEDVNNNSKKSIIASVTVVHPSASTADALSTYFFCHLREVERSLVDDDENQSSPLLMMKPKIEKALFDLCNEKVENQQTNWFGHEMQQVIVQWWTTEEEEDNNNSNNTNFSVWKSTSEKDSSSSCKNNKPTTLKKQVPLLLKPAPPSTLSGPAASDKFDKDITDTMRHTMQRMVAVIFIKIDCTFYLGCTLSSGSLLSAQYFNCQSPKLKDQLSETIRSSTASSSGSSGLHTFLFSAMKNSRLYNLLVAAAASNKNDNNSNKSRKAEIWLMLPRVQVSPSSSSSSSSQNIEPKQLSILSSFAGGKMVTWNELEMMKNCQSTTTSSSSSIFPLFKCPLEVAETVQMHSCNLVCGDHGVFTLPVDLTEITTSSTPLFSTSSSSSMIISSSTPILRAGRNYATLSPSSTLTSTPRLSASSKKTAFEQLLNPLSPTTSGIFTRISKNGQFFGVTCSNIEFISLSAEFSYSPILQLVCPLNELSLAALSDLLQPSSSSSSNSPFRLKLHIFAEHADAHSLLKWFADASFMDSTGQRTEHFMYLPSASDEEDAERYMFPGTAGKGGALYTLNTNIVFVDKASAGVLVLFVQVTGCKKHFKGDESIASPTFWWM